MGSDEWRKKITKDSAKELHAAMEEEEEEEDGEENPADDDDEEMEDVGGGWDELERLEVSVWAEGGGESMHLCLQMFALR